ncbi:hypothetical protein INR49_013850 [Caranx melampygus]|nr:hypothetical protein INR49_013850 [Caranx melampygus]
MAPHILPQLLERFPGGIVQKCRFRCWDSRTCIGGPVGPMCTGPWEDLNPDRGGSGVERM